MTQFNDEEMDKLAKLCRIEFSAEKKEKLKGDLVKVLDYIELLKEVNTAGVDPCFTVIETVHNVVREDRIGETMPRELFLANAPVHVGGMIRVPPVIKSSTH